MVSDALVSNRHQATRNHHVDLTMVILRGRDIILQMLFVLVGSPSDDDVKLLEDTDFTWPSIWQTGSALECVLNEILGVKLVLLGASLHKGHYLNRWQHFSNGHFASFTEISMKTENIPFKKVQFKMFSAICRLCQIGSLVWYKVLIHKAGLL